MKCTDAVIGHLDADSFYVSCERVRCEHLKQLPVGVLGNQGACVIAKSYEMKARGVKTGMPVWEAKKLCPEGVYVKRDFRWYEAISRQLLETLRQVSPAVEYYSIDEMFFDASELLAGQKKVSGPICRNSPLGAGHKWVLTPFSGTMAAAARALQQRILDEIGVPVSIGISRSRTLAKLGSDTAKPFGCLALLDQKEIEQFLASRPVEDVAGIGGRSGRKLLRQGILTCLDFTRADRHMIRRLLTIKGEQLWWELQGTPVLPLNTERPAHQMLNRGGSMGKATADPERVLAFLVRNLERLIEELDYHQVLTEHLSLALQYQQGGGIFSQIDLPEPTARFDLLLAAGKELLRQTWGEPGKGVRTHLPGGPCGCCAQMGPDPFSRLEVLVREGPWRGGQNGEAARLCRAPLPAPAVNGMHLVAGKLQYRHLYQGSLFAQPNPVAERIAQAKRFVNERLGRFAVRSGATLPLQDIYRDEAQQYDICDVRGKMCF